MKRVLVYIIGVVSLMTSCTENELRNEIVPATGEEVIFSAFVNGDVQTRTVYGADNNNSLNVYWVDGDKISVYGTTCLTGRQQAEYAVRAESAATPNKDANTSITNADGTTTTTGGQNFATKLEKTGDFGVQWGGNSTSDFCAIYPSDGVTFNGSTNGEPIIANTSISSSQNNVFEYDAVSKTWVGTHFASDISNPSMQNAIMYARTNSASPSTNEGKVDLRFKPLTTVLKFRFSGYDYVDNEIDDPTIYIQSITVTAPKNVAISGNFSIAITGDTRGTSSTEATADDPSIEGAKTSNSITLNTFLENRTYLPLQKDDKVEFSVFTIPVENAIMGGEIIKTPETNEDGTEKKDAEGNTIYSDISCTYPWTVTINTSDHGSFEYTMVPNVDGKTFELVPGKIHKIKVPQLTIKKDFVWEKDKWISQIPVPVYISELSMPGAWYCTHPEYQGDKTLEDLYKAGVRAFNIDCRLTNKTNSTNISNPRKTMDLVCAGTDESGTLGFTYNPGTPVLTAMQQIANLLKPNEETNEYEEYVVVLLTIAEKPLSRSGNANIFGTVDPIYVMHAIDSVLTNNATSLKLYTDPITAYTTIDDVRGKVIVKINSNSDSFYTDSFKWNESDVNNVPSTMNSFASMALLSTDWNTTSDNITDLNLEYYSKMNQAPLYWGKNIIGVAPGTQGYDSNPNMTYYYHQAQKTTSASSSTEVPTFAQRKSAITNIIEQSQSIYKAGTHNAWFQIGAGGYRKDSGDSKELNAYVAQELNKHVLDQIDAKLARKELSPVGMVFMNFAAYSTYEEVIKDAGIFSSEQKETYTTYSDKLIDAIISLNGKFYLQRAGETITTNTDGGDTKAVGCAVIDDNAF